MLMQVEVIAIGDELIEGHRVDTNSAWLSKQLRQLGCDVIYHTTVGDQLGLMTTALGDALGRSDVVICSGGLGPTADDLTRHAIAAASGCVLETRAAELARIERLFADRGRTMPPRNAVQAQFPVGSDVVPNPHGTAPGIHVQIARDTGLPVHLFALPGVPAEMREMWAATVQPMLEGLCGSDRSAVRQRLVHCFGIGESAVEQRLPDLVRRGRQPVVGITAHQATITLRIVAKGPSEEACEAAIEPVVTTIRTCLGDVVFGEGDDQIQDAVTQLLAQNHVTLATIEWGTRGLLAEWLAGSARDTGVYRGGVIATGDASFNRFVGVGSTAAPAVAESVAQAANHVRMWFEADWGLAVGPFPAAVSTAQTPEVVHMALATGTGIEQLTRRFGGHPDILQPRFTKQALDVVRLKLLGHPAP